jgi:ketosteroid isomerase-like protein
VSEQQNVAAITKIYEAFGRGEIPYIIGQLTDDVRWISRFEPIVPWGGDYSGKANVPKFFDAIGQNVDVTAFTPKEFVAQGDTVVSMGEFGCKVRATGKSALTPWVFIWKLRDGRVYSYEQFHDPAVAEAFR